MKPHHWSRAIILVDMNAFFASIEQLDNPEWRGQPIGITNGAQGTCIITSSYEARSFGIKTGMRLKEARALCPHFIQVPARPERYAAVSTKIMEILTTLTPDIEIFSVDEAFLDVTHCQNLWGSPEKIALMAKQKILQATGILCSIGVSGDKTTAKFAAKLQKPNGFTVIPPWESKEKLKNIPVTELCGIKTGIGNFLARYGVYRCGDMEKIPMSIVAKRFGNIGRRIWLMCQGADPEPVITNVSAPKSMGHGKVMPPQTTDKKILWVYLQHMSEKLGARLRQHNMIAQRFFIGWRTEWGWIGDIEKLAYPTADGRDIFQLGKKILARVWNHEPVNQIQVTAQDPQYNYQQMDFFEIENQQRRKLNNAVDKINTRFGEWTIASALMLERSSMPNVIAPAWKPFGHRQTI